MGISPKEIYMETLRGFNDLTQKMCKAKGLHKKLLKKKWGKYSLSLDVSLACVSKEARELYDIVRSAIEAQSHFPIIWRGSPSFFEKGIKDNDPFCLWVRRIDFANDYRTYACEIFVNPETTEAAGQSLLCRMNSYAREIGIVFVKNSDFIELKL